MISLTLEKSSGERVMMAANMWASLAKLNGAKRGSWRRMAEAKTIVTPEARRRHFGIDIATARTRPCSA